MVTETIKIGNTQYDITCSFWNVFLNRKWPQKTSIIGHKGKKDTFKAKSKILMLLYQGERKYKGTGNHCLALKYICEKGKPWKMDTSKIDETYKSKWKSCK